MIIDSHAHYDDKAFDTDRRQCLERVHASGVKYIINCAQDKETSRGCIELCREYSFMYCAVGIHPHEAKQYTEDELFAIEELAGDKSAVAIGEVGLDYHYDFSPRDIQQLCFRKHIQLAVKLNKPVVVHSREAFEDTVRILKEEHIDKTKCVIHCFTGSKETACIYADMGMYFSVGGAVTFKNARNIVEALKYIPEDKLMLETDCPYMTPEPFRGKRNDSSYIELIAQRAADILGKTKEYILESTARNTIEFFNLNERNIT